MRPPVSDETVRQCLERARAHGNAPWSSDCVGALCERILDERKAVRVETTRPFQKGVFALGVLTGTVSSLSGVALDMLVHWFN